MSLRIYRHYKYVWVSNGHFGSHGWWKLTHEDELQMQLPNGEWAPVPLIEGPIPQHPDEVAREQLTANLREQLKDINIELPVPYILPNQV